MDRTDDLDNNTEHTHREGHATTGGSAAAGAVTGGAIGMAAGPVGAVVGAIGGAIAGAAAERAMHADDDHASSGSHAEGRDYPAGTAEYGDNVSRDVEGRETIQLREEELLARKHEVDAGEVRIGKEVVTENRTLEVPVTHEELVIERHDVDRRSSNSPIGADETIRVPLAAEEVTVEKRAVVTEEIEVGKREVQETREVSGTVRREEARIEEDGREGLVDRDRRP